MATSVELKPGRPLSPFGRAVLASQQRHPDAPLANMALCSRLHGPVDPERLRAAFDQVVAEVDVLRQLVTPDGRYVPNPEIGTSEIVAVEPSEVDAWTRDRASVALDPSRRTWDSAVLAHPDGTASWYLCLHHTITDASSSALLFRRTAAAYHDEPRQPAPAFLGRPVVEHPRRARAEAWWADRAADRSERLDGWYRPVVRPTTEATRHPVDRVDWQRWDAALDDTYRLVSPDLSATALLAAATAAHLHLVSGSSRVRLGIPVHHRSGAEDVIGLVMEVFPLEVAVEADDTPRSLHRRTAKALLAMLGHALPGLSPGGDVDAVVNVIPRGRLGSFGSIPATTTWIDTGAVDPEHLLRVQLTGYGEQERELAIDVNHAAATADQRRRAPEHLAAVLDRMLRRPDDSLADTEFLTDEETAAWRAWEAATAGELPAPAADEPVGVAQRLLAAVAGRTDPVLDDGDRSWTGAEVSEAVARRRGALLASGVRPGDRVGVALERSAEAVLTIWAVSSLGASFVPLDPADPRRVRLAERAGCVHVIDQPLPDAAPEPPNDVGPDDEAYLLFTSGSTGEPKGVPIAHAGLDRYVRFALAHEVGVSAPRAPLFSALTFDLTITTLFVPPLAGGRISVLGGDGPRAVAELARRPEFTWAKATPSHLELLVRQVVDGHGLRTLVVGGEQFRTELADRLLDRFGPRLRLVNEYGPTEAVVGCMTHRYDPDVDDDTVVPIGVAAPGIGLTVRDHRGARPPLGTAGELWIAADDLTVGYLDRPDLTGTAFTEVDGRRAYRSGDLVELPDPGRPLLYRGRADTQLKVGGVRLEAAEIETALAAHPGVETAAVRLWTPRRDPSARHCVRCGLSTEVPGTTLDGNGVCGTCHDYDRIAPQAEAWFRTPDDLRRLRDRARVERRGDIDAVALLSGGKDSTYALYQLVEQGFRVYAVTLDNGWISEGAKENVRRSVADLGIGHHFATSEHMEAIFADSLARHSNVCHGCYKTIYTLGVRTAEELGAPLLVTGLSRGQLFETRLMPGQFDADRFDPDAIDRAVLDARRHYHRADDLPNRLLDTEVFADDGLFDRLEFVDFYRYVDVELSEMLEYLTNRAPWVRPSDTGRSTNCLINAAGIHTHLTEQGYHNYAVPYAWDVRLGHKTRDEALEELDDELDPVEIGAMLDAVGYRPEPRRILTAWYTTADGDALDPVELRRHLAGRLPAAALPASFVRTDELPQTANGKLDEARLPAPSRVHRPTSVAPRPPETPTERRLVEVWQRILRIESVGTTDDFFELGGDSLAAIETALAAGDACGITVPEDLVFNHPVLADAARAIDELVDDEPTGVGEAAVSDPHGLNGTERGLLVETAMVADTRHQLGRLFWLPDGALDRRRLEAAVQATAERHPALRSSFDDPRRPLAVGEAVEITWHDGVHAPTEIRRRAHHRQHDPLDPVRGPLWRVDRWASDQGGDAVAIVAHLAIDAGSLERLWRELWARVGGNDPRADLPRPAVDQPVDDWWSELWADGAVSPLAGLAPTPTGTPDGYVEREASLDRAGLDAGPGRTGFSTALAAVAVALRRQGTTGERLGIGLTRSRREHPESIGYFLDLAPLVVDTLADATLGEMARHTSDLLASAMVRRHQPGPEIRSTLRAAGIDAPNDLIVSFDDVEPSDVPSELLWNGTALAPATVFVQRRGERLVLGLEYRGDRFDEAGARRFLDELDAVLVEVAATPDHPVGAAPGRPARLVGPPAPTAESVLGAIARWSTDRADQPAVRCGADELDHGTLWRSVRARADELGPLEGRLVAVDAPRAVGTIVELLAVQLAGGGAVPVDPSWPEGRTAAARVLDGRIRPGTAYVILTSGSTGTPRAVAVDHDRLAASNAARLEHYGDEPVRFGMVSSFAFDSSVAGLYGTLATGGCVVLPTEDETHDLDALADLLGQVDRTLLVPSLYRALLDRRDDGPWPTEVIVAGEACTPSLVAAHHRRRPGTTLWNEYGPTEATVWATVHRCRPGEDPVPIGAPIAGATVEVIGEDGSAVAEGRVGELVVAGPTVTAGYLDDGEATARAFDGDRYRTGDRAWIADGVVHFAGRVDDQLSVGGVRLEPGEIEAALADVAEALAVSVADPRPLGLQLDTADPDRAAAALAAAAGAERPGTALAAALAAEAERTVLVLHVEGRPVGTELEERLATLPAAWRPRRIEHWDRLPRTHNGKIDRAALLGRAGEPLGVHQGTPGDDAVADRTDPELLASVRHVLSRHARSDLGPDDDFFAGGGDSLAAMEAVVELEDRLDRSLAVTVLVDHPTPRRLAAALDDDAARDLADHPLLEVFHEPAPGQPIVVLLAPGGGHLLGYRALRAELDRLGVDAVVGLRLPGLDGGEPAATVEEQCDAVTQPLERVLAGRRAVLVGGSSGGLLAVEIARRHPERAALDTLVMFDTVHPDAFREERSSRTAKWRRLWRQGGRRAVVEEARARLDARLPRRRPARPASAAESASTAVKRAVDRAAMAYRPDTIPHRVRFVAAATTPVATTTERWASRVGELEVTTVAGDHAGPDSLGQPHRVGPVAGIVAEEWRRLHTAR